MWLRFNLLDIDPNITLDVYDFLITPVFIALILSFATSYRNKHYPPGHPWRRYFIPALWFKLIGSITITLIYVYYYKGGDTNNYFFHGKVINSAFAESPRKWLNLILAIPTKLDGEYFEYTRQMFFYGKGSTHIVSAITAVLSGISFDSILSTSLIFSVISFTGVWALFRTFAELFPKLITPLATGILFIPSVALWGSGIFKDTLILFSLGWLTRTMLLLMVFRRYSAANILSFLLSLLVTFSIKIYVVVSFLPPVILWIILERTSKISNKQVRVFLSIIAIILSLALLATGVSQLNMIDKRYSLVNVAQTSATTRDWILYISKVDGGSAYSLGEFNPTFGGMLSKFPQAVNVTLYRPYPWEARKLIVFLTSLESLLLLLLTLKVIAILGIRKLLKATFSNSTIQFCLVFSLTFAFSVGISSYNFGALSRYKIPCIPFFLISLILIFYSQAKPGQRLFKTFNL